MKKDYELFDENNPDHLNPELYEVMEEEHVFAEVFPIIGTIEEDSHRRDFTIGAVYYHLKEEKLIDPNGTGINDILDGVLRFIGKPKERLDEDSLRVIRFYRFISRGWEPTPKTLRAVRENFSDCIDKVNNTRIMTELEKIVGVKK